MFNFSIFIDGNIIIFYLYIYCLLYSNSNSALPNKAKIDVTFILAIKINKRPKTTNKFKKPFIRFFAKEAIFIFETKRVNMMELFRNEILICTVTSKSFHSVSLI